jgi:UDP-N-acetylglucosamine 2-epimerase (non-hydrolysing)
MTHQKIKVMTIVGTRPELIKLASVIKELDRHTDHVFVHTGQNYDYELNGVFFENLGLRKPDYFLDVAGDTASITVANVITKTDELLEKEQPEALLILGDTNSCLAAYPAKRRKIPIFHMEAGNRCFDMRVPEEVNRRVVDHLSDINLVYSEAARTNLLREGLPPDRIIKTGSSLHEVLMEYKNEIEASTILTDLDLTPEGYFVLSAHREENVDDPKQLERLVEITKALVEEYHLPILFGVHPRTQKRIESGQIVFPPEVRLMKSFGLFDYVKLQMNAKCVLTDSGTIQEESSMMNFPAVQLRVTHERLESSDEMSVITAGRNPERVLQAVAVAIEQQRGSTREFRIPQDYEPTNVSKKVLRIIIGYTDYVKRVVWSETV